MRYKSSAILLLIVISAACDRDPEGGSDEVTVAGSVEETETIAAGSWWDARLDSTALERGRFDASWQRVVQLDTLGFDGTPLENPERFEHITPTLVNTGSMYLPLRDGGGPSTLRAQILLDRALFSPGIIDGRWGMNTSKALYWFQSREGLRRTGLLDRESFDRLVEVAGGSNELIRSHRLTDEDVEGPFISIPDDVYEMAELDCLCYESLTEKLAELFHTSPEVLTQLNPEVDLEGLTTGDTLHVPAVRDADAGRQADVSRIEVSADGFYVHAIDDTGRIVYHFPSTLGSSFDPSPTGDHRVTKITRDPWWHYQPSILAHVDSDEPEANIPPGPNNAVGLVWMALSIPHYGIHGTSAPETIGYTTSAGCVRLTNWDALFLADRIEAGVPVQFTGT